MRIARTTSLSLLFLLTAGVSDPRANGQPGQDPRAWVAVSNKHAQLLLDVLARFAPEGAGQFGVSGLDAEVTTISMARVQEGRDATQAALAKLQDAQKAEKDPFVGQDLDILIRSAQNNLRAIDLSLKRQLPYTNVTGVVFGGLRSLLDPQIPAERRAAAVVRLRNTPGWSRVFHLSRHRPCRRRATV